MIAGFGRWRFQHGADNDDITRTQMTTVLRQLVRESQHRLELGIGRELGGDVFFCTYCLFLVSAA